jgi:hypothetical protein
MFWNEFGCFFGSSEITLRNIGTMLRSCWMILGHFDILSRHADCILVFVESFCDQSSDILEICWGDFYYDDVFCHLRCAGDMRTNLERY